MYKKFGEFLKEKGYRFVLGKEEKTTVRVTTELDTEVDEEVGGESQIEWNFNYLVENGFVEPDWKHYPLVIEGKVAAIIKTNAQPKAVSDILADITFVPEQDFESVFVSRFEDAGYQFELLTVEWAVELA